MKYLDKQMYWDNIDWGMPEAGEGWTGLRVIAQSFFWDEKVF